MSGSCLVLQNSFVLLVGMSDLLYGDWGVHSVRLLFISFGFVVCVSGDNYMSPGILAQLWVEEEKKRKELERKLRETLQANQVWDFNTVFSPW